MLNLVGIKAYDENGSINVAFNDELKKQGLGLQLTDNSIELYSDSNGILCRCEFRTEISNRNDCYSVKIIEEWS